MTENEIRSTVVATAAKYVGAKEGGSVHKQLIDIYNADKPLPRGYPMKYTDAWCAAFVTTVGILCKLTDIIFKECGCEKMITLYKNAGRWQEDDSYKPDPGDVIFYDWDDSGSGDCKGNADHVGIVEKVSGSTITVIEGNYSDSVKRRTIAVNGRYIRGYGLPNYASKATSGSTATPSTPSTPSTQPATKTVDELADEVIKGLWGNGNDRKQRLTAAGYDYAAVQAAVNKKLSGNTSGSTAPSTPSTTPSDSASGLAPASGTADPKTIWDTLMQKIGNACGVAGLMGNMYAESALIPNNLQNTGNTKTGMSDAQYTAAVDAGTYTNFVKDSHGYGLCQWTYHTRKQALLNYAKQKSASIGNLAMQLEFAVKELSESYAAVMNTLKTAKSVREASDAVLLKYERPANTGTSVQEKRASYGQKYFDQYASGSTAPSTPSTPEEPESAAPSAPAQVTEVKASSPAMSFTASLAGTYTIRANGGLNIRDGAGTSKKILVVAPNGLAVKNYGYYTNVSGTKWLYIQFTLDGVKYTGFASGDYLTK